MESNYTFSIELSTGSKINEDLHDGVGISLGTPVGDLNGRPLILSAVPVWTSSKYIEII